MKVTSSNLKIPTIGNHKKTSDQIHRDRDLSGKDYRKNNKVDSAKNGAKIWMHEVVLVPIIQMYKTQLNALGAAIATYMQNSTIQHS